MKLPAVRAKQSKLTLADELARSLKSLKRHKERKVA